LMAQQRHANALDRCSAPLQSSHGCAVMLRAQIGVFLSRRRGWGQSDIGGKGKCGGYALRLFLSPLTRLRAEGAES
jgi:hypothetical protein